MSPMDSPCTNVCTLDASTRSCLGCGRTLDEIQGWSAFSAAERATINAALPARCTRFKAQRVAEAARIASRWPVSQCSRCGTPFTCGASDCSTPCWCASYPPVDPAGEARCMCPGCLAAMAAAHAPG